MKSSIHEPAAESIDGCVFPAVDIPPDVNIIRNADGSGRLSAVTRTSERTLLRGFRGSVAVAVLDANRNKLWVSKTHTYGVDGTLLGTHDRTENWVDSVPVQLLPQAVRYTE